jgi:hypothetical protein
MRFFEIAFQVIERLKKLLVSTIATDTA